MSFGTTFVIGTLTRSWWILDDNLNSVMDFEFE
jgi:hypothetical protein